MNLIVALLGAVVAGLGAWAVIRPGVFRDLFQKLSIQVTWVLAVVLRLAFGTLLLVIADELRLPHVMTVIGWIAIVAAVIVLLMGPERLEKLVIWWLSKPDGVLRVSAVFVLVFGAFMVWAAV